MGFLNNFFNRFRDRDKREKREDTEANEQLNNMKDIHVSFGEDPGSLEDKEDEKK